MLLKAVVFDWAGTLIDHGSRAPSMAFVEAFRQFGVPLTEEEARAPMGLPKRDHIMALLDTAPIGERWRHAHGASHTATDIDRIFAVFEPINTAIAAEVCDAIPGAREALQEVRKRGLKIGSTTGYTRQIMAAVIPAAASSGIAIESIVCAGDTASGRPGPLMMYKTFLDLDVWPARSVVKVDDTEAGIAEGLAAGCWTIGVTLSGNAVGLSLEELTRLSATDVDNLRKRATQRLLDAGAHLVIDSVAHLMPALDTIEARLEQGIGP